MTKRFLILFLLGGLFAVDLAGTRSANANPGCDDYGRCFEVSIRNSLQTPIMVSIAGQDCYEGETGSYSLAPGQSRAIGIARVQGHGCNGHQGYFSATINGDSNGAQNFDFDNGAGLELNGVSSKYFSALGPRSQTGGGWTTYEWSVLGLWNNPPICGESRCFPVFVKNSLTRPIQWKLIAGNCYEGNQPAPFTLAPQGTYQFSLARVQGHGCDGNQGEFGLQPVNSLNGEVQNLNFTNDGGLGLTNTTYSYSGTLQKRPNTNAYIWDVNSETGSNTPVAGCGDKGRCFWLNLVNQSNAPAVFALTGGDCYEGTVGTYTIPPLQQQKIGIARIQGHGCDGRQGHFNIAINNQTKWDFDFSNDAGLQNSTTNNKYDAGLSSRAKTNDGWYFYNFVLNGEWQTAPICDNVRCFQLFVENALETPVTWKLNAINCYEGTVPSQPFTVRPGERYQFSIARVQGHGCDGKQGEFELQPTVGLSETQKFNFSNDGGLALTNLPTGYLAYLSEKGSDNAYSYIVDANIVHQPSVVASTIGTWTKPAITQLQLTTEGFWPNYYQSCAGYEVYHNQHVVRLPNDKNGNAYFVVAQSREHNGYITLLKVDSKSVDKASDAIAGSDGAVVGKAVWQHVFTGRFNGTINPVGNWNHPGKMSYIDGVLAVAAQNWDMEVGKQIVCGNWYSALGTSEDKVIFYDLRNIAAPHYVGAITASELGVKNHELATVELAYDPQAKKYLLVAGGDGAYPVLSATTFNPSFKNWTVVPSGPGFSGQHGLAFELAKTPSNQLWYFDASREEGRFNFTSFNYSANPPYLTNPVSSNIAIGLPGANRDWDASSIYISPTTQKPIVYTVKSLDGANYQLYQVLPGQ
jgi:hypothetical protein